jgi:diguanylate cyclase (GGDEF)-like protein/PAS domain S-box-containing protein
MSSAEESARLEALRQYRILDTRPEPAFDRLAATAAAWLGAPAALVTFVDGPRSFWKARAGIEGTEGDATFCRLALASAGPVAIEDAAADPRVSDSPAVVGPPHVRAWAGVALRSRTGVPIGSLCVLERAPRPFAPGALAALESLARLAEELLELRLARVRAEDAAHQLRVLLEAAPLAIVTMTVEGVVTSWNPAAERLFGWTAAEAIGRFLPYVTEESRPEFQALVARMLQTGEAQHVTRRRMRKDGALIQIDIATTPFLDEHGEVRGILSLLEDVTERKRADEAMRLSEESFRRLIERAPMGISITREGQFLYVNGAFVALLGHDDAAALVGRPVLDVVHPDARAEVADRLARAAAGEALPVRDERLLDRQGQEVVVERTDMALSFQGQPVVVTIVRDVTEERRLQASLLLSERAAARVDPLTGLLNRRGFDELVAREIARADREGTPIGFVMFDIDHFKAVNDRFGHATGDRVLRGVARAVAAALRASDVAIRWGGEEILAMLPATNTEGALRMAERVRRLVERLIVEDAPSVTVSAGVAERAPGELVEAVITRADERLYEAKDAGRNRVR